MPDIVKTVCTPPPADALTSDELAGALIELTETIYDAKRRRGRNAGPGFSRAGRGETPPQIATTLAALRRNRAQRGW